MVPLVQRLADLLRALQLGPRTFPDAIRDLLRALAAAGIQDDPAAATPRRIPVPGLAKCSRRWSSGPRKRHGSTPTVCACRSLKKSCRSPHRRDSRPIGRPRYTVRSSTQPAAFFALLPSNCPRSCASWCARSWRPTVSCSSFPPSRRRTRTTCVIGPCPTGSVWIHSTLLVPADQGFAGLRIAAGTLTFAANAQVAREGQSIVACHSRRARLHATRAARGGGGARWCVRRRGHRAHLARQPDGRVRASPPQVAGATRRAGLRVGPVVYSDASSPTIAGRILPLPADGGRQLNGRSRATDRRSRSLPGAPPSTSRAGRCRCPRWNSGEITRALRMAARSSLAFKARS